jgi:hypothetical protein
MPAVNFDLMLQAMIGGARWSMDNVEWTDGFGSHFGHVYMDESYRAIVKSCSPASSRLSATPRHLSHHLRMKALRRVATSLALPA